MSLFIEPWRHSYKTRNGKAIVKALNLWKLEDGLITKIAEYIYWPSATKEDPNYWVKSDNSIIKQPVKKGNKLYKSECGFKNNWILKPLNEYPEAFTAYNTSGIIDLSS